MTRPSTAPGQAEWTAPRRRLLAASAVLLMLMLVARIPSLKALGHGYDLEEYRRWAAAIQQYGLANVFDHTNADYVGFHYLLWLLGALYRENIADLTVVDMKLRIALKAPGFVGDLVSTAAVMALAYVLASRAGVRLPGRLARLATALRLNNAEAAALGAGLLWGLSPALIYASTYWGQNDSLVTAFALVAVWAAMSGRPVIAAVILGAGATIKPQPLIVAPVVAWAVLHRSGWRGAVRAAAAGTATLVAGHLYFVITGDGADLAALYRNAVLTPELLSFSAYNLWWPVAHARRLSSSDVALWAGPFSVTWGMLATVLVMAILTVTLASLRRRRDLAGTLLACAYLIFGYFMVGSGTHERYAVPALAFLTPALTVAPRWILPALAITVTCMVNVLMTLPLMRLYPQGEPHWLTIVVSAVNLLALGWITWLMLVSEQRATSDEQRAMGNEG